MNYLRQELVIQIMVKRQTSSIDYNDTRLNSQEIDAMVMGREAGWIGEWGDEEESRLSELSLTGRNETGEAVTSRLYFARVCSTAATGPRPALVSNTGLYIDLGPPLGISAVLDVNFAPIDGPVIDTNSGSIVRSDPSHASPTAVLMPFWFFLAVEVSSNKSRYISIARDPFRDGGKGVFKYHIWL
ncbi:hypothetical protein EVAR_16804_1 [Eumeta japonica]|uniref:Uncharacterized protein n=1 Tax=Eumeta variegata TaxID=151549 RepID=A0A4C1UKY2_EUMVA|nr:hypothetical protein EVAR_16804_1 [Eumeta japonica]